MGRRLPPEGGRAANMVVLIPLPPLVGSQSVPARAPTPSPEGRSDAVLFKGSILARMFGLLSLLATVIAASFPDPSCGAAPIESGPSHAWSREEGELLRSLWIGSLPPPPNDPTNAFVNDPKAQELGEQFFFDPRFSKNGKVACASCHLEEYNFTEEMPRAQGMDSTTRRTQPLIGVAYSRWFFWDGRADTLWSQALGPLESAREHGITRTFCVQVIANHYGKAYTEIFGPLPKLPREGLNPVAKPDPEDKAANEAWMAIPPATAHEINRVYANMGKAIAAFERMIVPGPTRFDRYVEALLAGDAATAASALDKDELAGLALFIGKAKCVACHNGPLFTNGEFRKTGVYQPSELPPDRGRADGTAKVLASEYNCLGAYSDAQAKDCRALRSIRPEAKEDVGAFKVPTLRNVAERAPYMHAGQYWSLGEVVRFFERQRVDPLLSPELARSGLSDEEQDQLVAFLRTLSGSLNYPKRGGVTRVREAMKH